MKTSMLFTGEQIASIYASQRSGADYPRTVQQLQKIGVLRYEHNVTDSGNVFHGAGEFILTMSEQGSRRVALAVSEFPSTARLKEIIGLQQRGETDYPTFCVQAAQAGVARWTADLVDMLVTYYDSAGRPMLAERIPAA
jgi:uncharacterized protein YbcV (DUF1398 family)